MHCQSPHEAALGEKALPDRPADGIALSVRFQFSTMDSPFSIQMGVTQPMNRSWCYPKNCELPVIF